VARSAGLVAAVEATGAGAFVADTAPLVYRLERRARSALTAACDPLFDAVGRGDLGCMISAISVAEVLVAPLRARAGPAVVVVDAFLRQRSVGIAEVDGDVARAAAHLLAEGRVTRLPDALILATGVRLGLPIVTGDRRLARAATNALLVADFAR
jgi:predicted nucleic acid-binding protein